jgi:hypothetical protein
MAAKKRTPADAGVLAAGLLVDACQPHSENSLRLEVVGDLALDLGSRLLRSSPEKTSPPTPWSRPRWRAPAWPPSPPATSLLFPTAKGLSRQRPYTWRPGPPESLCPRRGTGRTLEEAYTENTLRDARSAGWRADLAEKQLEV